MPRLPRNQIRFGGTRFDLPSKRNLHQTKSGSSEENLISCKPRLSFDPINKLGQIGKTGEPAKHFHGVGIGPLSKILTVKDLAFLLRMSDDLAADFLKKLDFSR